MTKLMEWLIAAFVILGSWIAVLMGQPNLVNTYWYLKWFPLILIFCFGIYCVITILYRVITFNNCESAAAELRNQIKEARADLESKGIRFKKELG